MGVNKGVSDDDDGLGSMQSILLLLLLTLLKPLPFPTLPVTNSDGVNILFDYYCSYYN